jgi:hypothetical protein
VDELAARLEGILSCNGAVLPEKYRAIIPRTLITQRAHILSETEKILDALGLPE